MYWHEMLIKTMQIWKDIEPGYILCDGGKHIESQEGSTDVEYVGVDGG